MPWRKPKAIPAPPRQPHSDPATEQKLQRILGLRAFIDRDSEAIEEYRAEILRVYDDIRDTTDYSMRNSLSGPKLPERERMTAERVAALQAEIGRLEAAIERRHDEIEKRMTELDVNDLAWL